MASWLEPDLKVFYPWQVSITYQTKRYVSLHWILVLVKRILLKFYVIRYFNCWNELDILIAMFSLFTLFPNLKYICDACNATSENFTPNKKQLASGWETASYKIQQEHTKISNKPAKMCSSLSDREHRWRIPFRVQLARTDMETSRKF